MAPVRIAGRDLPFGLALLLAALLYFALAELGLGFAQLQESVSPLWPAAGFAVALLSHLGKRLAPAVFMGAVAANLFTGGIITALPIALGNTLEALAGAWLLQRFSRFDSDFFPLARTAGIVVAAFGASLISAATGIGTLLATGMLDAASPASTALTWWAGDSIGILLVTPVLLHLAAQQKAIAPAKNAALSLLLIMAAPLVTWPAFAAGSDFAVTIFLTLPVLVAAIRWSGAFTAAAAMLATGLLWAYATSTGHGPFVTNDANAGLLNMQIMLAAFAISGLMLGEMRQLMSWVPQRVFLAGALVSATAFAGVLIGQHNTDRLHLVNAAERLQDHIEDRIGTYTNVLRGGASLYAAAREIDQLSWQRYVDSLDLPARHPGFSGLGVVLPTDKAGAAGFTQFMRSSSWPDFAIKPIPAVTDPDNTYPQHFLVSYFEPIAGNESTIGRDLATEPNRRAAAILARDNGNPTISAPISLLPENTNRPGFILFMPMYREPIGTTTTETTRWYFYGWIIAPFLADTFFDSILRNESRELALRIYDGSDVDPARLVYESGEAVSNPETPIHRSQLLILGRDFTIEWRAAKAFDQEHPLLPIVLSACGILFSGLLAALIATLMSQKDRAIHFADRVSAELALANERFQLAVDCSQDVIWDHDMVSGQTWASPRLTAMFGYRMDEIGNDYWGFWQKVMEPADFQIFQSLYEGILAGTRETMDKVLRYRHRDGHQMHVQTRCQSVRDATGKVVRVIGVDTDITLVMQLENRLRGAIDAMADGFGLFDADDRVVLYNDRFIDDGTRKIIGDPTGCTFEEILRTFAYHDMPVTDPAFDREAWIAARLERHRNPPEEPIEVTWGDGRVMRISERRTQDGGYVGIWADVTEIKRLGQRLQDAIAALSDGFALYDADDRLIVCNDSFVSKSVRAHFDHQPVGHTFSEIYRAYGRIDLGIEEGPELEAWLQRRIDQHRAATADPYEIATPNGLVLRVLERRTTEGGTVGTWTDVTALRRAEERMQDAIESINEGFLILDAEGRYAVFNAQLLRLYPKSAPHVKVGAYFKDVLRLGAEAGEYPHLDTPEAIDIFVEEWTARFRDATPFQGAAPLAGGGWVLVSHRPTSDGGCVNIYTDITALKERESDLAEANVQLQRQAQALTVLANELRAANLVAHEANLSKSQFLANMSHELRTPLNGIIGFADIMRAELFGKISPPRYGDYIADIHSSGQHLLNLINDILDLSKIEAGKMSLQVVAVDAASVADHALRLVAPIAQERGVVLAPPDLPPGFIAHADERQFKQILLNLLSNAVKFTPAGGRVSLAIADAGEAGCVVTVTDTGIGMTPDEIKLALERFGQADSSYAKSTPGTGLGLPLVDGLVKLHGGSLVIDSEKGRGTIVTVRLPWRAELPRNN
jgi:PAS domain S-box-containing protein